MGNKKFVREECSMEEICRICTMHYENCLLIPIFKHSTTLEIQAHQIIKFFFDFLQLEIMEDDSLPQNICQQCYTKFVNFKIFLDKCVEAHNTLITAIENSKLNEEPVFQEKNILDSEIDALEKKSTREIEFLDETIDNQALSVANISEIKNIKQQNEITCIVKNHDYQDIGLDIIEEDSNVEMLVEYENYNNIRADYIPESEFHIVDNDNVALLDCSYCNYAFPEEYFALHINDYHPIESPFLCTKCFRNFRTQGIRDKHVLLNMCQINEMKLQYFQNIAVEIFIADDDDYGDSKAFNEVECLEQTEFQNEELQYEKNDLFSEEALTSDLDNIKENEINCKRESSLKCPVCMEKFTKTKFFSDHLKRSHPDFDRKLIRSKYGCEVCDKDCKSKQSLESHLNSHKGIKPYACEICKTSFFGSKALRTHMNNEHSSLQFNCEICGKDFNKKSIFVTHMSNHKKDNDPNRKPDIKYKCQFCPRTFNTVSTLTIHSLTHKKLLDSKHICNVCGVTFKRADHLKMHMYGVHLDHKPFPCEQCDKSFPTAWQRNTHVKKYHSAEKKKYKCQVCPNEYASSNALKRHNMVHTGELKYNCDICEQKFPKIFLLEEHLKTHEIDENQRQESINEVYMEIAKSVIIPN